MAHWVVLTVVLEVTAGSVNCLNQWHPHFVDYHNITIIIIPLEYEHHVTSAPVGSEATLAITQYQVGGLLQ